MLVPLLELAPELELPGRGLAADALERLDGPGRAARRAAAGGGAVMLLVVDVGNTQTHLGVYDGEELVARLALRDGARVDRRRARRGAAGLLALRGLGFADLDASIVSATVPSLRPQWTAMAQRYLGHEMLLVGPGPEDRACRSATTTRARSARTGSSTPSPATSGWAARA